jgi:hypothetical protein
VKPEMERMGYLSVVATSAKAARAFFGLPPETLAVDAGAPAEPSRWKPNARVWHLYPDRAKAPN